MHKDTLLELLKNEALLIDEKSLLEKYNSLLLEIEKSKIISPIQKLLKYNIETMIELKNKTLDKHEDEIIEDMNIELLKSLVNNYMDTYAEGQNEQKIFIGIIAVYLTFIAKKPLHPEGMFNLDGKALYKHGNVVCPIRKHELTKPGSLCRFCVSVS